MWVLFYSNGAGSVDVTNVPVFYTSGQVWEILYFAETAVCGNIVRYLLYCSEKATVGKYCILGNSHVGEKNFTVCRITEMINTCFLIL